MHAWEGVHERDETVFKQFDDDVSVYAISMVKVTSSSVVASTRVICWRATATV